MHASDHLAHSVFLRGGTQQHGCGYWKFPRYLFNYPKVVSAIERKVEQVLDQLRRSKTSEKLGEIKKKSIKT